MIDVTGYKRLAKDLILGAIDSLKEDKKDLEYTRSLYFIQHLECYPIVHVLDLDLQVIKAGILKKWLK